MDGEDFRAAKRLPLARTPGHMAFSADSPFVFVTRQESDEIAAIRLADQTLVWKMKVNRLPAGIWLTPDVRHLLVGVMGPNDVEEIDWRAQKSAKRIVTGKGAHNFRPLGDGRHIFVGNRVASTVSVIEQATLEKKYDVVVPNGPDCMEVSADGKWLWVTQRRGKSVAVVDIEARRIAQSIPPAVRRMASSSPIRHPGANRAAAMWTRTAGRWRRLRAAAQATALAALIVAGQASAASCTGHVYLTLDTGSMGHATKIADILRRQDVRATFFLANETTPRGDWSLDPSWAAYWKARADEGHAFDGQQPRLRRWILAPAVARPAPDV